MRLKINLWVIPLLLCAFFTPTAIQQYIHYIPVDAIAQQRPYPVISDPRELSSLAKSMTDFTRTFNQMIVDMNTGARDHTRRMADLVKGLTDMAKNMAELAVGVTAATRGVQDYVREWEERLKIKTRELSTLADRTRSVSKDCQKKQ